MSDLVKLSIVLVFLSVLALVLKKRYSEYRFLMVVAAVILFVLASLSGIKPLTEYLENSTALNTDNVTILIRILGIAYLSEICASLCRDAGENTLALGAEMIAKAEAVVLVFPLVKNLLTICEGMIK